MKRHEIPHFSKSFWDFSKMDKNKCPKKNISKNSLKNACLLTIIEFYRKDVKKTKNIL